VKKMPVWKLTVLTIVTLGIYQYFWLASRRKELIDKTKLQIPHIAWLIVPAVVGLLVVMSFFVAAITTSMFTQDSKEFNLLLVTVMAVLLVIIAAFTISCWWFWKFGKAVEQVTKGKVTANWSFAYWVFFGPAMAIMQQYFFNQLPYKTKQKPSRRFIAWSVAAMAVSLAISIFPASSFPADFENLQKDSEAMDAEIKEYNDKFKLSQRLYAEHNSCIAKLDADYPVEKLTDENIDAYNSAYDACEEIRVRQNKAAQEADEAAKMHGLQ
jgi:glucan phosphoethanolaminetransferase (alkaline phosphatase superfamily)